MNSASLLGTIYILGWCDSETKNGLILKFDSDFLNKLRLKGSILLTFKMESTTPTGNKLSFI